MMPRFPRLTVPGNLVVLVVAPGLALVTLVAPVAVPGIAWLVVAATICSWDVQASRSARLAMRGPFTGREPHDPGRERHSGRSL